MKKEKQIPILKDSDVVRKLESSKYNFRGPQNTLEGDGDATYEWVEDSVIRKRASAKFGKDDTGKDTATIQMIDPETKEKKTVYFTSDETEVSRLKDISEGRGIRIDVVGKVPEDI